MCSCRLILACFCFISLHILSPHFLFQTNIVLLFMVSEEITTSFNQRNESNRPIRLKAKSPSLVAPISTYFQANSLFSDEWSLWRSEDVNVPCPESRIIGNGSCQGGLPRLRFKLQSQGENCSRYFWGICIIDDLEPIPSRSIGLSPTPMTGNFSRGKVSK